MVSTFARIVAAGALVMAMATDAVAHDKVTGPSKIPRSDWATVGDRTSVPLGWIVFCRRYSGECGAADRAVDVRMDATAWKEIADVNEWVNRNVAPVSDIDHWGVEDRWDFPVDGKGDCEDYVLLKRKMLVERGVPQQALLVTVVRDEVNRGHAVLTVKSDKGEYLLDNRVGEVRPWREASYTMVKRQSQTDPNAWVSIMPDADAITAKLSELAGQMSLVRGN